MTDVPKHGIRECPLNPVDRRLSDLHRQWHDAEVAYFDPDGFRVAIQTCIQTARTVTFILQSNKALFSDFETWYAPWQEEFRSLPLMKWMVDARNTIEKRGDLETHSELNVSVLASYLSDEQLSTVVNGDLFDSAKDLLGRVPKYALAEHVMRNGILQIERRWVANSLPDLELLDAVAYAYGHLSRLLHQAHVVLGLPEPTIADEARAIRFDHRSMEGRLPCMIGHSRQRTLNVWLATGQPLELETASVQVHEADGERAIERYGIHPKDIFGLASTPEEVLKGLFATARQMFLTDQRHITIAFLLKGAKPVDITELRPAEHGHKYLMAQMLADRVTRVGADCLILIGEVWTAKFDPLKPLARAADSADKTEALTGTLVSKEEDPIRLVAEITRVNERAELKATVKELGGAHYLFAPIYKAWGRDAP
jgi:hypothetical protein